MVDFKGKSAMSDENKKKAELPDKKVMVFFVLGPSPMDKL
jgi:hypothetical protein